MGYGVIGVDDWVIEVGEKERGTGAASLGFRLDFPKPFVETVLGLRVFCGIYAHDTENDSPLDRAPSLTLQLTMCRETPLNNIALVHLCIVMSPLSGLDGQVYPWPWVLTASRYLFAVQSGMGNRLSRVTSQTLQARGRASPMLNAPIVEKVIALFVLLMIGRLRD